MIRNITKILATAAIALSAINAKAQLHPCSTFMISNHLELGVNWNGAFGASSAPPAGSHANTSTSLYQRDSCGGALYTGTSLAMVADPGYTNWATYYGDFVLPGGAKEGWSMMYNGDQYNAWSSDNALADTLPGMLSYIYSYTDTLGIIETKTQSINKGIYTTQWVTLDTAKLFFTMQVLIENTTLAPAIDLYYMRVINPHNDQSITGNPNTWCNIQAQGATDTGHRSIVTAKGTVLSNAYLAIGCKDDRATVFAARNSQLPPSTIDNIIIGDPAFTYAVNDSVNANTSIGVAFSLGNMVSGGYTVLNFFYAFSPAVLEDAFYNNHLGVGNIAQETTHYHVFPNPATNSFKLLGLVRGDEVQLFDMIGRQVSFENISDNEYTISNLPVGNYVVVVKGSTGIMKGRVAIQKN